MVRAAGICGVILAAGSSTRMGRDKALLPWPPVADGVPSANTFLGAAVDLLQPECDMVLVVAGQNAESLRSIADAHNAFLVVNPKPERGQFSSIQTGLQEVLNRGRDAAILDLMEKFLRAPASATAREIEHQHQMHILYVPVADERVAANIDTPEEYERLLRSETIAAETTF